MEQQNFEKHQMFFVLNDKWLIFCFFTFNSRANIIIRYNFNEVRCYILHCFFVFKIDLMRKTRKMHEYKFFISNEVANVKNGPTVKQLVN